MNASHPEHETAALLAPVYVSLSPYLAIAVPLNASNTGDHRYGRANRLVLLESGLSVRQIAGHVRAAEASLLCNLYIERRFFRLVDTHQTCIYLPIDRYSYRTMSC